MTSETTGPRLGSPIDMNTHDALVPVPKLAPGILPDKNWKESWTIIGSGLKGIGVMVAVVVALVGKDIGFTEAMQAWSEVGGAIVALIGLVTHEVGKRKIQGEIKALLMKP